MIYDSWQRHWNDLSEFFKYPPEIRKAIYTTNAVESLNFSLRKVIKNKLLFVNDDAIFKIQELLKTSVFRSFPILWRKPLVP